MKFFDVLPIRLGMLFGCGISRCNRLPILLPSLLVIANIDPKS